MIHSKKEIQDRLIELGYDVGPDGADGKFGDNTARALNKFEQDWHIPETVKDDKGQYTIGTRTMETLFPTENEMTNIGTTLGTVAAEVKSAWASKVNWTLALTFIFNALAFFGFAVPQDVKDAVMMLITSIGLIAAWVIKTWFTTSISKPSAQKLPNV